MINENIIKAISSSLKAPTTYLEQIEKLKKRNLIIENEDEAVTVLKNINYYHFTGYLHDFRDSYGNYKEGLTFNQIKNIVKFDMELKNILLYPIELIEMGLKTNIAYIFSSNNRYGNIAYYFSDYFDSAKEHEKFMKYININVEKNKEQPFIKHHLENYGGYLPIWVIVEIFTLGNLEHFYKIMKLKDKKNIAKRYGYSVSQMMNWIYSLRRFRNTLAHNGRLYNSVIDSTPLKERSYKESSYKIFDYILIMKYLIQDSLEWEKTLNRIEFLFKEYNKNIDITCIGFPKNWKIVLAK